MQVHNIQSNNYNNYNSPNFGLLNVTEAGTKMINSWHGKKAVWSKIDAWKKELAETKHFDLEIDELCHGLWLEIKEKCGGRWNCEAPLRVEDEPKNNSFWAFGTDLIDPGDWVSYPLEFDSSEEAKNAYATLRKHQHDGSMPTLELLEWAVESVKILDQGLNSYMTRAKAAEAANTTKDTAASKVTEITDTTNTKLPFGQRLKKAWFVLTGKNT